VSCLLSPLCIPFFFGSYVYFSLVASQGGGIDAEEEFNPGIRVNGLLSLGSQDLLSFYSISRDWILKLDPHDNFSIYPKFI